MFHGCTFLTLSTYPRPNERIKMGQVGTGHYRIFRPVPFIFPKHVVGQQGATSSMHYVAQFAETLLGDPKRTAAKPKIAGPQPATSAMTAPKPAAPVPAKPAPPATQAVKPSARRQTK